MIIARLKLKGRIVDQENRQFWSLELGQRIAAKMVINQQRVTGHNSSKLFVHSLNRQQCGFEIDPTLKVNQNEQINHIPN